jgi:hypothetical protein
MKDIVTKQDLLYCYPMYSEEYKFITELCGDNGDPWGLLPLDTPLEHITGCTYHMVQTIEDLAEITTLEYIDGNLVYVSVLQGPVAFDDVRWSKATDHMIIFSATNNGGGPVWYIPRAIVEQVPNLPLTLEKTKQYWSHLEGAYCND